MAGWRQELRLDHIKQHVCHWFAAFNFFEEKKKEQKNPLPISQCPVVEILSPVFPPSPLSLSSLLFLSFCFVKGKKHKKPKTTCFLRSRVCVSVRVSVAESREATLRVSPRVKVTGALSGGSMDELHYGPSRPADQHSHSDLLGSPRQEMDGGSLLCSQVSLSSPLMAMNGL